MTFLVDPYRFAAAAPAAGTLVFVTSATSTVSTAFNGTSIGAASSDRMVIVGVTLRRSAAAVTVTSVTLDGNRMHLAPLQAAPAGLSAVAIAYLPWPASTTANIAVTGSGAVSSAGISVFSHTGTPVGLASVEFVSNDATGTATVSLTIPDPCGIVGAALGAAGTNAGFTWTGLTEEVDAVQDITNPAQQTAAKLSAVGVSSPLSISATNTNTNRGLVAAAFAPITAETAPTVVQAKGVATQGGSITLDAAPTSGNLLVALQFHFNNSPAAATGWTQHFTQNAASQDGNSVYYKVAGASESATQTPTSFGAGGTGVLVIFEIANFMTVTSSSAAAVTTFLDGLFAVFDTASAASYSHTETTAGTNELIIGCSEAYGSQVPSMSGVDATVSSATSGARGFAAFRKAAATAGGYGVTASFSPNVGSGYIALSIRPKQA
jgi:hypothetical protein